MRLLSAAAHLFECERIHKILRRKKSIKLVLLHSAPSSLVLHSNIQKIVLSSKITVDKQFFPCYNDAVQSNPKRSNIMRDYFMEAKPLRFLFPIDGDCVNRHDGAPDGNTLLLPVTVEAPQGADVAVNGIRATEMQSGVYHATVPVRGYRNALLAENRTDGTQCRITVFRMPAHDEKHFRISSDDNIRFLKELNDGNYASIFDHPYLAVYQKAHERYGAKVHLNLFYEFDDRARSCFSDAPTYFNLSMMTDRYKDEFRQNADWLKLAFHAQSEFPDAPYKNATAETITRDCVRVCREIIRFASIECIPDTTTVHWGEANPECVRALRALGFRSLTGYFVLRKNGVPSVSYYAPPALVEHVDTRDFWVDTEENMIFGKIDRVLNVGSFEEIMQDLVEIVKDPHRGGFVSVMIHEQYFYKGYKNHLPDFEQRVLEPVRYLYEHGYTSMHVSDAVAEPSLRVYPEFR
jgi:hypothetical protein